MLKAMFQLFSIVEHFDLIIKGPHGFLEARKKGVFIFRKLGSCGNYLRGPGEQAHSLGGFGSHAKK